LDDLSAAAPDFAASARAFSAASRACCVAIDAAGKTMRFGSCVVKDLRHERRDDGRNRCGARTPHAAMVKRYAHLSDQHTGTVIERMTRKYFA
jgi:hypothetical protein